MEELKKILGSTNIKIDEPLKEHTKYEIGGAASFFAEVNSEDDLRNILKYATEHNIKIFCIGKGSNILARDEGFSGIVIKLMDTFKQLYFEDNTVICGAAVSIARLVRQSAEKSLSGLEWLIGIPGTVGGAVVNNSGSFGHSISEFTVKADIIDSNGNKKILNNTELEFGNRTSIIKRNKSNIITTVYMELEQGDRIEILDQMNNYFRTKEENQPIAEKNIGCVFKNGISYSAGQLIDNAGLKGITSGDAQISEKHANFIINRGSASSNDIITLINLIKEKIKEKNNIELSLEIEII